MPALCTFPDDFVQEALDTVPVERSAVQTVQRFRLVLLLHEQPCLGNEGRQRRSDCPPDKYNVGEVAGPPAISPSKIILAVAERPLTPLWIKR